MEEAWLDPCLPAFPLFQNHGFLGSGSEDELGVIPSSGRTVSEDGDEAGPPWRVTIH